MILIAKRIIAKILTYSLIGKLIALYFKNKIPFHGLIFDTKISEISPVTKAEIFWKIYESSEIRLIKKNLPLSIDVIELGSSMGVLSSLIRKRLYKDFRLICVEAHPALSQHSIVNLKLNKLNQNVTCLNRAISSSKANENVIFIPGNLSTTGRVTKGNPTLNSILVEKVTLSELRSLFHINEYTLIADIEGAEVNIIREDRDALKQCSHLFMELHNTTYASVNITVDEMLLELIDIHGFCLKARHGNVVYLNRV